MSLLHFLRLPANCTFSIRDSYQIYMLILGDSHEKILKLPNGKKKHLKLTFVLS